MENILLLDNQTSQRSSILSAPFESILGEDPLMRQVLHQAETVAPTNLTVLLLGETGTGKGLLAQAIVRASERNGAPFVPVDCGALPETLLESELFGYERGAFTGAYQQKRGLFEVASGGTLFLDEIANLSQNAQGKLLRILETKEVQRLGSTNAIPVDVRIIAATNTDLSSAVQKGAFRQDLYYRLSEFTITLPPLRQRCSDLIILAEHFLTEANRKFQKHIRGFDPDVLKLLTEYPWPGNVRELKNVIQQAALFATDLISLEHLPASCRVTEFKKSPLDSPFWKEKWWQGSSLKEIIRLAEKEVEAASKLI